MNKIVVEKIEEASNIAQDAPEIIKKEFDSLKEAIIEEAARMEKKGNKDRNTDTFESNQDSNLSEILIEIEEIKEKIQQFNMKMNNTNK